MRRALVLVLTTLVALSACGHGVSKSESVDRKESERCSTANTSYDNAVFDFEKFSMFMSDPRTGIKGWTLEDSFKRNKIQPNEGDRYFIRLYYTQYQLISDNPLCFEPDEVAEARQMLR